MVVNHIAEWRGRHKGGITKAHLARQIGVSRSYVGKLEQGRSQPSVAVLFVMAAYFGCPVEALFQYVPDGNPEP